VQFEVNASFPCPENAEIIQRKFLIHLLPPINRFVVGVLDIASKGVDLVAYHSQSRSCLAGTKLLRQIDILLSQTSIRKILLGVSVSLGSWSTS